MLVTVGDKRIMVWCLHYFVICNCYAEDFYEPMKRKDHKTLQNGCYYEIKSSFCRGMDSQGGRVKGGGEGGGGGD